MSVTDKPFNPLLLFLPLLLTTLIDPIAWVCPEFFTVSKQTIAIHVYNGQLSTLTGLFLTGSTMNNQAYLFHTQTRSIGLGTKLMAALLTSLLLIGGFFASLFLLAIAAVVTLMVGGKLWWTVRSLKKSATSASYGPKAESVTQKSASNGHIIEGEFQVKQKD